MRIREALMRLGHNHNRIKPYHKEWTIFTGILLLFLLLCIFLPAALAEEEEEESFGVVLQQAGLTGELHKISIEMFEGIHDLENSFRDQEWNRALNAVKKIDRFFNNLLTFIEKNNIAIHVEQLQAFEFSLTEISSAINSANRRRAEMSFLKLQPELFDILDSLAAVPLRLAASRLYIDMAIEAYHKNRFDVVLDELGEIEEYTEQLEDFFQEKNIETASLKKNLEQAREFGKNLSGETLKHLDRVREDLMRILSSSQN